MNLYLDYNATAPLRAESRSAMLEAMNIVGNASSVHRYGRQVRQKIEQARQDIGDFFETNPAHVIFTSGATEANHLALCGFRGRLIISAVEHDSVDQARQDREVCSVDEQGIISLRALEALLQNHSGPTMISLMAANNETGVIQPVDRMVTLAKRYGAFVHCDSVQIIGRASFPWEGIDLISLSAHKVGGPQGIGALINKTALPLSPQFRGGGQERSFRAGTENFLGIMGFAAALKALKTEEWDNVRDVRNTLEAHLRDKGGDSLIMVAQEAPRLPNTTTLIMKGVKSATQVMGFDLAGFAVSSGAACSSGKVKPSRVLAAMGVPEDLAACAIRVSFGPDISSDVIEPFTKVWMDIRHRAHKQDFSGVSI